MFPAIAQSIKIPPNAFITVWWAFGGGDQCLGAGGSIRKSIHRRAYFSKLLQIGKEIGNGVDMALLSTERLLQFLHKNSKKMLVVKNL